MSELQQIIWTSAATLISGAFLFVLSQVIADLFLKPVTRFRELLSDLCFAVIFHSDYLCSSRLEDAPDRHREISKKLRELSARLTSLLVLIPFYWLFALLHVVPRRRDVEEAAKLLIRLSNLTGNQEKFMMIYEDREEIGALLRLGFGRRRKKEA